MTHSIPTETRDVKPAEILHADAVGARIVRLDGYYSSPFGHCGGIQETFAELGQSVVTLCSTNSFKKPKKFSMHAETMDTLCQAWQQFRADQKSLEEQNQREYDDLIKDLMQKVSDLGGELIQDQDGNFELIWPRIHPMHGLYKQESCLPKHDVEERLKHAEQLIKEVQEGAVRNVRTPEDLAELARRLQGEFQVEHDKGFYTLVFYPASPFHGFWHKVTGLTLAQVDYRLRYVEGIKTR